MLNNRTVGFLVELHFHVNYTVGKAIVFIAIIVVT